MTVKKHLRAQEIAAQNRLPCIYLVDSGGANLPHQDEVFPDRDHFGRIFYNQANMSAARHRADRRRDGLLHRGRRLCAGDVRRDDHRPQPGHDLSRRPAAGEGRDRRSRQRRGTRRRRRALPALRRRRSFAENDAHALGIARAIVANLEPRKTPLASRCARRAPPRCRSSRAAMASFRPTRASHIDVTRNHRAHRRRQRIRRIQAALRHRRWSRGFAHICGYPVGIIANNGILFSESAQKGAHFIELCRTAAHSAGVSAEHHRLHGRREIRGRRHRQGRR